MEGSQKTALQLIPVGAERERPTMFRLNQLHAAWMRGLFLQGNKSRRYLAPCRVLHQLLELDKKKSSHTALKESSFCDTMARTKGSTTLKYIQDSHLWAWKSGQA